MRFRARPHGRTAVLATTLGLVATGWSAAPLATADTPPAPPVAVENLAYPGATEILAERGITITRGDGRVNLVDCADGNWEIRVGATTPDPTDLDMVCFDAPYDSGYVALSLPQAYLVKTVGRSVRASLSVNQKPTETLDVPANTNKAFGEGVDPNSPAVLLELRITGSTGPAPAVQPNDAAFAYTAKIDIGNGKRSCSGALVDPLWVLTATSCFTDTPDNLTTVTAGTPKDTAKVTVGRTDLTNTTSGTTTDIVELVPRTDRDLVLARLTTPVTGITPAKLATTAPASGESLKAAGYGRSTTTWEGRHLGAGAHTATAVTATTLESTLASGKPVCAGDAGAPVLREAGGTIEIAAVVSRSWQGTCLGTPATETRTNAQHTRADSLGTWVQQVKASRPGSRLYAIGGDNRIWANQGNYGSGVWGAFDVVPGNSSMKQVTSVTMGNTTRLYAIGGDNRIWTAAGDYTAGTWTAFEAVPGNSSMKQVTAVAMGNVVRLFAVGGDDRIWTATGDYTAGTWTAFEALPSSGIQNLAVTTVGNTVRLFAVGSDTKIWTTTGDYTAGTWSTWAGIDSSGISDIAATTVGNTVRLYAVGSDTKIWVTESTNNSPWSTFGAVPDASGVKKVAATTIGDTTRLFAIGSDTKIWTTDKKPDGSWTTFITVPSSDIQNITATTTG
ncbi:trypsin-like serine protease [Kitasatospora sp. NPDC058218]|uniref:trypsin-like serine protease n=1 Tax=Kitasatospora sp. NPDC058218 TaxID=3346385 RepID=UPI0036D85AE9